jgi:hypothetical protein
MAQLSSFASQGESGLLGYYSFLESKGYSYASLAKGVVTGDTPSGAIARQFASNVAQITGADTNGLSYTEMTAISVALMEADLAARSAWIIGHNGTDLDYQAARDYHVDVFDNIGLSPTAWTPFVPLEYSGLSAEGKQEAWEFLVSQSDGGDAEFLLGLGAGAATYDAAGIPPAFMLAFPNWGIYKVAA